jgi:hypothetical protein
MTVVHVKNGDGASKERGDASKGREECEQGAREMQARGEGSECKQRAFDIVERSKGSNAHSLQPLQTQIIQHGKNLQDLEQICCSFLLTTKSYVCFAFSDGAFLPLSTLHYI